MKHPIYTEKCNISFENYESIHETDASAYISRIDSRGLGDMTWLTKIINKFLPEARIEISFVDADKERMR